MENKGKRTYRSSQTASITNSQNIYTPLYIVVIQNPICNPFCHILVSLQIFIVDCPCFYYHLVGDNARLLRLSDSVIEFIFQSANCCTEVYSGRTSCVEEIEGRVEFLF